MNSKSLSLIAITAVFIAACSEKPAEVKKVDVDDIIRRSQPDVETLTNPLYQGGQPGQITVSGIIVRKNGDSFEVDERINLFQAAGVGKKNNVVAVQPVADKNLPKFNVETSSESLKTVRDSKTFINLGCENIDPSAVEGLTQDPGTALTESVLSISAKKIFICGKQNISASFVTIAADELILKDASIEVKAATGSLSVESNKIFLEGKNEFKTLGLNAAIAVFQAPSLDLKVSNEIHGEGKLSLESKGGDCIPTAQK